MVETQEKPKVTEPVKTGISIKDLDDFLSNKIDLERNPIHKIDQTKVSNECYRVNVWTKTIEEDSVVPSFSILESFYLEISSNGEIVDQTIRKGKV